MTASDGGFSGRIAQTAAPSATDRLLAEAADIGGIYKLGFGEAQVLTNDLWVREAGGVPEHCFLLAVAREPDGRFDPDDEEVLLLRVTATAPVPGQSDLDALRAELTGDLVIEAMSANARPRADVVDPYTDERAQIAGLSCQLLGTFYNDTTDPTVLVFGADLDTAYQSSRYRVLKPFGKSLEQAVSYIGGVGTDSHAASGDVPNAPLVEIGRLRYSATQRRARRAAERGRDTAVPVRVKIEDFVANKTAVFGMTRSGKSNTMKVLATEIFRHSKRTGAPIGQLLFDPHGEYAFLNEQDETALSELGPEYVVRYRLGATSHDQADGIHPLSVNLLAAENVGISWQLACSVLQRKSDADYIRSIMVIDPVGPPDPGPGVNLSADDRRLLSRTRRCRLLIWAALIKAGVEPPSGQRFLVSLNQAVVSELKAALPDDTAIQSLPDQANGPSSLFQLNRDQVLQTAEHLCSQADTGTGACAAWLNERAEWQAELVALKKVLRREGGVTGYLAFRDLIPFHSPSASGNYAEHIHDQLVDGQVVIVDLSHGSEAILQSCAERIIGYLLDRASERFRENVPQPRIQLFLEEAHVLFNRDRFRSDAGGRDPYVRLAKEAAKFKLGMIFATQEVTAVEEDAILNNTANWIVAHLNNRKQTNELSYYEDFQTFTQQILRSQDKGFVRLKTLSADFTIPMMVRKFDRNLVEEVRREALAADAVAGRVTT